VRETETSEDLQPFDSGPEGALAQGEGGLAGGARPLYSRFVLAFAFVLLLGAAPAVACHDGPPVVPAAELEKAPPSVEQARAGTVHDVVTTKSKKAQKLHDRGLALFHSYDWIRAARAFREAARLDPDLAMARLGLSMVENALDDPAAARAAWKDASSRAKKASKRERARIEAWGLALDGLDATEGADRFATYRAALDAALKKWPDDAELLLMRGNAAAPLPPGMSPYQSAASVEFFERVLAKNASHPAAHHYLVHALENDGKFPEAERHAAAFAKLASGAPHAIHMHGHGLMRIGKMSEAIARFEEADRTGAAIRAAEGIADAHDWHHSHNLSLLTSAYRHEGRMKDAEAVLRRLAAIPALGDDAEIDRKDLASFLLGRGRHADAIDAANELGKSRLAEVRAMGHAIAGEALLALGRTVEAKARLADAQREHAAIAGDLAYTRAWIASLYVDELALGVLLSAGRFEDARETADRLVESHRAMRGPDGWAQALFRLERLAALARETGDWTLAESVALAIREHDPSYAGGHLARAAVARHAGHADEALRAEVLARKAWPKADPGLLSP